MINERLNKPQIQQAFEPDIEKVLTLAKQSHENYLIRSTENDLENAVTYYLQAIKINPSIPEVYYKLASLLWEKGQIDIDSALEHCQKSIKLDPNSYTARLYLGYFLKAAGKYSEAEEQLNISIKLNSFKSGKARIAMAALIIQKFSSSSKNLKDLIKSFYYLFSGLGMLSLDFNAQRMFYKSIFEDISTLNYRVKGNIFKKIKNYTLATKNYNDAAEKTGKKEMFYTELADLEVQTGNPIKAVRYYKDAIQNSPTNVILWVKLTDLLQKHYNQDVDELLYCYKNLSKLDPCNSKIYYELGHLHLKQDDKFCAVNSFKKAIRLDAENAYYHNSLAFALVQLEDYDGAISEYQKAIRLNPDKLWTSIVSQALGAIFHQVKNNVDAAIQAYQTSVVLDPCNVDAYIALGEVYHDKNDLTNAIDSYCEAIKIDPAIPRLYCSLGLALWEKDYADEAVIAYQKAVEIDPDYEIAFNNLGVVYMDGLGRQEEAIDAFTKAIKANPNYALAYFNRGRAYQILGNKTEAANEYQMSINLNKLTNEFDDSEVQDKLYQLFQV